MELTQTKTKENLSLVNDDDKIRLWQDSQTIDSNSEVTTSNSQQRNDNENSDEHQPGLESEPGAEAQARPQETSKKTKKKKAKSKKADSLDMLRNGQEGELVEVVGRQRRWEVAKTSFSAVLAFLLATQWLLLELSTQTGFPIGGERDPCRCQNSPASQENNFRLARLP